MQEKETVLQWEKSREWVHKTLPGWEHYCTHYQLNNHPAIKELESRAYSSKPLFVIRFHSPSDLVKAEKALTQAGLTENITRMQNCKILDVNITPTTEGFQRVQDIIAVMNNTWQEVPVPEALIQEVTDSLQREKQQNTVTGRQTEGAATHTTTSFQVSRGPLTRSILRPGEGPAGEPQQPVTYDGMPVPVHVPMGAMFGAREIAGLLDPEIPAYPSAEEEDLYSNPPPQGQPASGQLRINSGSQHGQNSPLPEALVHAVTGTLQEALPERYIEEVRQRSEAYNLQRQRSTRPELAEGPSAGDFIFNGGTGTDTIIGSQGDDVISFTPTQDERQLDLHSGEFNRFMLGLARERPLERERNDSTSEERPSLWSSYQTPRATSPLLAADQPGASAGRDQLMGLGGSPTLEGEVHPQRPATPDTPYDSDEEDAPDFPGLVAMLRPTIAIPMVPPRTQPTGPIGSFVTIEVTQKTRHTVYFDPNHRPVGYGRSASTQVSYYGVDMQTPQQTPQGTPPQPTTWGERVRQAASTVPPAQTTPTTSTPVERDVESQEPINQPQQTWTGRAGGSTSNCICM